MSSQRIDVHHHFLPPRYLEWLASKDVTEGSGRKGGFPEWSPEKSLSLMDSSGIQKAILSISTPGISLTADPSGYAEMKSAARMVNEEGARIAEKYPDRFGFLATLPMPDVAASIEEACFAIDHLGASGVILMANYHGRYIADSADEPLLEELNKRKAVILIHPSELPAAPAPDVPPYAADFLLDTSRAAYRFVANGLIQKFPDLRVILAHAGGFIPFAAYRLAASVSFQAGRPLPEVIEDFQSFYFDTALSSSPSSLPSLMAFARANHVLYGSDFPFVPESGLALFTGMLDQYPGFDSTMLASINNQNAESLFSR
jgi:6-methylsalicylate decarboxylase